VGDSVFFVATAGESGGRTGVELWRTDGTNEGTVLVKDIAPGPDSSLPQDLIDGNGVLYFKADDDVHGFELWTSDGTKDGTVMVADLYENAADGEPEYLTVANVSSDSDFQASSPTLFFAGYQRKDGITTGNELWKLSLPETEGLSDIVSPVAEPPSGFVIDAGKPQISLPGATEIAPDSWLIEVQEGNADIAPAVADEPVTWGLVPGADSQRFEIDEITGELVFSKTPDFDDPYDSDFDNVYKFDLTALDSAGNESTAAVEVRVNPTTNHGGVMVLANSQKKPYQGTSGADSFLFKRRVRYGRKQAPKISGFDAKLGDQILFGGRALKKMPSLDQLDFKVVRSKKNLRKASQKGFDLIYFKPKGWLYYDQNSENKGFGKGGLMAVLLGGPRLNEDCFAEWMA
jgi:ELWxxDGT repeat protein